jgi:hypothetical protein
MVIDTPSPYAFENKHMFTPAVAGAGEGNSSMGIDTGPEPL